ncbi:MAG: hypothetical protein GTN69_09290 [Armatimonadetes bacterium]|nr:hypothetical protein [Armatimonadota bacterium]NIO76055.1 hypothetical protein [Armatimonadota bacterium]NIO97002.1 hypothetical protein [Armatimonadota bacterium]
MRNVVLLLAGLLMAFVATAEAGGQMQSAALVPSLRLERIVRLAQAYSPAPADALICPRLSSAPRIDASLRDWPELREAEYLMLGGDSDLSAVLRAGWNASALYLAVDIRDDAVLPAAADDWQCGDLLAISLSREDESDAQVNEENVHTFFMTRTSAAPILLRLRGYPKALPSRNLLAINDYPGRRVVEIRLPWKMLSPISPLHEGGLGLVVRIEDRDSPHEIEPTHLRTSGRGIRLALTPDHSNKIQGHLSLGSASVSAGESLKGILLVDSPQPAASVKVGLEILDGRQDVVARISRGLELEGGVNSFRLSWNSANQPEGDYLVRASASTASGRLFSLGEPFKIGERWSIWEKLDSHGKNLSTSAVLARLQKDRADVPAKPLKFAVLGDLRGGERIFFELLREAANQGAEFAIVPGDLVNNGKQEEYLYLARVLEDSPLPVLTTTGNHDFIGQGLLYYQHLFGPLNYTFELDGFRFIVLDNALGRLSTSQLDWLETQLQTPLPRFVLLHMPPDTIQRWAWHSFSHGAKRFTDIMEQYLPSRVFVAHIHAYDRVTQNGVEYVLSGGAGAPLYKQLGPDAAFYHFVLVEAGPEGVTDTVIKMTWQKGPKKAAPEPLVMSKVE